MNRKTMTVFIIAMLTSTLVGSKPDKKQVGEMSLVALGDCIISRKISVHKDPGFLKLLDLVRKADCAWANCEMPIVDIRNAYPQYREMDLPGASYPWVADELKWMGVDMVGFANNHTMDYGKEGLFSTIQHLERVGIAYAGAGKDLEEAARPRYADTPGGRVGQVSCAGTIHPGTHASLPHPYMNGRPGLNPLGKDEKISIEKKDFMAVKKIFDKVERHFLGDEERDEKGTKIDKKSGKEKEELYMRDFKIIPGESIANMTELKKEDLDRITQAVKIARRNARVVIVSVHEHMGEEKQSKPAAFLETFARACIDAGADVVFNTGPHRLWGIEIYKNKPIFYSLGNFFFQINPRFPSEIYTYFGLEADTRDGTLLEEKIMKDYFSEKEYWQGVLPRLTFDKDNNVTAIELYPLWLGQGKPIYETGDPTLATGDKGREIIQGLITMSEPYKTAISYKEGIGTIKLK